MAARPRLPPPLVIRTELMERPENGHFGAPPVAAASAARPSPSGGGPSNSFLPQQVKDSTNNRGTRTISGAHG